MKVLFVGSNPSQSSTSTLPFWQDSKSRKVIDGWMSNIIQDDQDSICFANVSDHPTDKNRPLKMREVRASLNYLLLKIEEIKPDRIVALGNTASTALTLLRYAPPFASQPPKQRQRVCSPENKKPSRFYPARSKSLNFI